MATRTNNLIMERLGPGARKGLRPGTRKGCHYMSFPSERNVVASLVGARPAAGGRNVAASLVGARTTATVARTTFAVVLAAAALFSIIFLSPTVHAASPGRIYGQLLDGSNKNAPLARQSVTLQMAQGNTARDLASVTTDAHGSYTFANLSTDKTISYALYMRYQGAQYTSDVITLATRPIQQLNLTVYEATTSTANVAIIRATVLLRKPDAQKGIIIASELFIFRNLDTHTYVGSLDASHGKPNALLFSLPHTARNVALGKGFDGYKAIQVNLGIASDAALPPGDSQFAFTFDMPFTTSSYDFDYTVVYPTVQLSFLVPTEIHASSGTLSAQAPIIADQHPYSLWQANALLANRQIHVQLDGLPAITPASSSSATTPNPGIPWLIAALLGMLAILGGTLFLYRSSRRPTFSQKKPPQRQSPRGQQQRKNVTTSVVEADKVADKEQALLQALLDLDQAFEAGKITKAVYQERRAKTKARLRALLSEKVTS